jgi:two-component system response regulator DesR
VASEQVREGLVAMLSAREGFRVVADVGSDDEAIAAARTYRPRLAVIETELSGCGGWWAIQQIQSEQLACTVVALGRRAEATPAESVGAQCYVQMGIAPRELLSAVEMAIARGGAADSGAADHELLADADPVVDEPALMHF